MIVLYFRWRNVKPSNPLVIKHPRSAGRVKKSGAAPATLRPPLKWAGGKRWLLPHLESLWRPFASKRYVEPFCGGLACPLGLRPHRALLNDINPHLVNFYTALQRGLSVDVKMKNDEATFYAHRTCFNELIRTEKWTGPVAAQLFYYLNRTCFNGLCRFNQSGEFNVPFGRHTSITYIVDFSPFKHALKDWRFTNSDIESLQLDSEDFIYADPPYDVEFTTYSPGGFSWEDQVRTAQLLALHSGPVVVSNQATSRIVRLYKNLGFEVSFLDGPRRISCTGDRSAAKEVLAVRNLKLKVKS